MDTLISLVNARLPSKKTFRATLQGGVDARVRPEGVTGLGWGGVR
ncbi:MAG: hypothetical protein ACRDTG_32545 [Pseudonocardiaceae bacterium]